MSESSSTDADGHLVFVFLLSAVFVGVTTRYLCGRFNVSFPYSSSLLIVMTVLGLSQLGNSDLSAAEIVMSGLNPDLLQYIFLPVLLLEIVLEMNVRNFRRLLPAILLLLIPGMVITALLTAVLIHYGLPQYQWDWITCLLLGAVLVATDTMSIVRAMRKAGVSERLSALIEGESILVDCVSFILVTLFLDILLTTDSASLASQTKESGSLDVGHEVGRFFQEAICGPLFGLAIGLVVVWFLYRIINDAMIEISVTVAASYSAFFIATNYLKCNGNLAVVAFALYFSQWERHTISPAVLPSLHDVLRSLSYAFETIIFAISGVMASYYMFVASSINATDVGYCFALYIFLFLTRTAAAALLSPAIRACGFKLNWKDVAMIGFSGIRGVQALVLMLTVVLNPSISSSVSHRIGFQTSGIVLLTNLINAPMARLVIRWLRLKPDGPEGRMVLAATIQQMKTKGEEEISSMKTTRDFHQADWLNVDKLLDELCVEAQTSYLETHGEAHNIPATSSTTAGAADSFLERMHRVIVRWGLHRQPGSESGKAPLGLMSPSSGQHLSDSSSDTDSSAANIAIEMKETPNDHASTSFSSCPSSSSSSLQLDLDGQSSIKQREDLVERFLELQRTEYLRLYDTGCLSRAATISLMQSIDQSIDRRDLSQQWKVIEGRLKVPVYLSFLYISTRLRRLGLFNGMLDHQLFVHFCVSVEICAAFCRAEEKLKEFLACYPVLATVNPDAMDDITREAAVYANRARAAFDDVRAAFPEAYSAVHSRHALLTLLTSEERTLKYLHDSGLLSALEFERLNENVADKYVRLRRSRLQNTMKSTEDTFLSLPYTRHLQATQQSWLLAHAVRLLMPPGQSIVSTENPSLRGPGVYVLIRGKVAGHSHQTRDAINADDSDAVCVTGSSSSRQQQYSPFVVVHRSPETELGSHGKQQRLEPGAMFAARALIDDRTDLYITATVCEVLFFPLHLIRPALTEPRFEAYAMRTASAELLKSTFAHLSPYRSMTAEQIATLVTFATFASNETNTSDGPHSSSSLDKESRVLVLCGQIELSPPERDNQSEGAVSVTAPSLAFIRDGPVNLRSSHEARWVVWSPQDEIKTKEIETNATLSHTQADHPAVLPAKPSA